MIDWPRVNELRDEVGPEDFEEVVQLFLEEVDEVIFRLKANTTRSTLEDDLHFLKGSALSLGFRAFSNLCQEGERQSASGGADGVGLGEIFVVYDRSKQEFLTQLSDKLAA